MKYFERCKIFYNILIIICVLLGFTTLILTLSGAFDLSDINPNKDMMIFLFLIFMFILFSTVSIILKCIIKDGQEDLEAITKYLENQWSDLKCTSQTKNISKERLLAD